VLLLICNRLNPTQKHPNRHPRHTIAKDDRAKAAVAEAIERVIASALVSLSRDAGQLVKRRELPEVRSPILRQAIARIPIEVFLGGRFGSAKAPHQEYDWRVSGDRLNQFPQEQGREKSAGI
jgi:hypothetical protein